MDNARLRFGNFLAPSAMPVYRAIAEYVGQRLGCSTHVETGTSYDRAHSDFEVCFICGLAYVELARDEQSPIEPIAAPVLVGRRYAGKPVYYSDVVVRRESPFYSFEDLRGRSWSYNEPYSQSGYGITRYSLAQRGETSFFGQVVQAGSHARSIEWICSGKVDASAIDSHVLELAFQECPSLRSRLRVLSSLGPSTIQPVTVAAHVPQSLRRTLQQLLVQMADDPLGSHQLRKGLIERFVPIEDHHYDDIRTMQSTCVTAGVPDFECVSVKQTNRL